MTLVPHSPGQQPPQHSEWLPHSWTTQVLRQAPEYPDAAAHDAVISQLSGLPPLVLASEIRALKAQLAQVAAGKALLLQGGDCAESFAEFHASTIRDTQQTLLEMALILGRQQPVVSVGRIAGQFAKPRSASTETLDGITLPSYRGDIVNGAAFDAASRTPNPQRMLQAYFQSAATLNLLRAMAQNGYGSATAIAQRHRQLVERLHEQDSSHRLRITELAAMPAADSALYCSHEALLLPYETALTRRDSSDGRWYDCSAHMVWIGDRTRQLDSAHLEFCRGIANPLGLKCGPSMTPEELLRVLEILDPQHEPGRISLIVRLGADQVRRQLPPLLNAVRDAGRTVIWSCDPMHGNTRSTASGRKTRPFDRVVAEVQAFFEVHREQGTHAGGLHLEMTGKDVTECIGGIQGIDEAQLDLRYHSACDPRLNASQALELACIASEAAQAASPLRRSQTLAA